MNGEMRDTLLRIAQNPNDGWALIVLYEQCRAMIQDAHQHWFGDDLRFSGAGVTAFLKIRTSALSFDPSKEDARQWMKTFINDEFARLRARILASDE
jgi:hypothetical protein